MWFILEAENCERAKTIRKKGIYTTKYSKWTRVLNKLVLYNSSYVKIVLRT